MMRSRNLKTRIAAAVFGLMSSASAALAESPSQLETTPQASELLDICHEKEQMGGESSARCFKLEAAKIEYSLPQSVRQSLSPAFRRCSKTFASSPSDVATCKINEIGASVSAQEWHRLLDARPIPPISDVMGDVLLAAKQGDWGKMGAEAHKLGDSCYYLNAGDANRTGMCVDAVEDALLRAVSKRFPELTGNVQQAFDANAQKFPILERSGARNVGDRFTAQYGAVGAIVFKK